MPQFLPRSACFFVFLFSLMNLQAQPLAIHAIVPVSDTVLLNEKFELSLDLTAAYNNPYDYADIQVQGAFTSPSMRVLNVDGFFMQDYALDTLTGALLAQGQGKFKLRFAPAETGLWRYRVMLSNRDGSVQSLEREFVCLPGDGRGFVRADNSAYFRFDDGSAFVPVGENVGWHNLQPYLDYKRWLTQLQQHGANFFRYWHCHWGLGIEWKSGASYQGLLRYQQQNARYQDWLFDFCAENELYVMLCLHHHGQLSTQTDPAWADNPYNAANGGPCVQPWQFFTLPAAKELVKNRLRYIVARWGYSRNLMAWELFNEVDWVDGYAQYQGEVASWHAEMAAFLKSIDPYEHLLSTSFAKEYNDPAVWWNPHIDFTQTHTYSPSAHLSRVITQGINRQRQDYPKPVLNGEFGLVLSGGAAQADPDGIHFHNALWASFYAGAAGPGMSWWWNSYIEARHLYPHFSALRAALDRTAWRASGYRPHPLQVEGAAGSTVLVPVLGWGALADTLFRINRLGEVSPAAAALSSYLYGRSWNSQYRRPPVFEVDMPQAGSFAVRTGPQSGVSPVIRILVNGVQAFQGTAQVNQSYTVALPAGMNRIVVDNVGTDWISIAEYVIQGLGSSLDAYALMAADSTEIAGYLLNENYTHAYLAAMGLPPLIQGANMVMTGLQDGAYGISWYDCLSGALRQQDAFAVVNGLARVALPDLQWDMHFVAKRQTASIELSVVQFDMLAYPNPAAPGAAMYVRIASEHIGTLSIELLDAAGRQFGLLYEGPLHSGEPLELRLPQAPAGVYWLLARQGKGQGVAAMVLR